MSLESQATPARVVIISSNANLIKCIIKRWYSKQANKGFELGALVPLSPYLTGLRLFRDNWRQTSRVARKVVSKQSPVIRNFLACVAKWRKVVAKILNMFKKFMRQNSSQNGRKVIAGVSNPSRTCRRPLAI